MAKRMTNKLSEDLFRIIKELKDEGNLEGLGKLASAILMFECLGEASDKKFTYQATDLFTDPDPFPDVEWTSTKK